MIKSTTRRAAIAGLGAAVMLAGAAHAQSAAEKLYSSTPLTMVISAGPGGGADFFGRTFAPFFSKHLPGNPDIIPQNLGGAGGMKAAIQMQKTMPKDGSTIVLLQRSQLYVPVINSEIEFDPRKAHWIGSLNKEFYTVVARADSGIANVDDLFEKPVKVGATSFNNENRIFPTIMNEYLGTKFEIIAGYDGNAAVGLALERGEIGARMQTTNTLASGDVKNLLDDGTIKIIGQFGVNTTDAFDTPENIADRAMDDDVKGVISFFTSPLAAGRPFAVPGEVPDEIVAALRKAFDDAVVDPEFIAEMERLNAELNPISGEEIDALLAKQYGSSPKVLENATKILTPN